MPWASARRRASPAGNWPGSSSSGRLLMIVRTPAWASASISARSSLPAALDQIAGTDPEPLQATQRRRHRPQIAIGDCGLRQQFDVPPVHLGQPVAQPPAFVGEPDMDRAAVMHRTLLREIAVLDHFLD